MRILNWAFIVFCCTGRFVFAQPAVSSGGLQPMPLPVSRILAWDALRKTASVSNGVQSTSFVFNVTNISAADVVIMEARGGCSCTEATLPSQPWVLPPGSNGAMKVSISLAGKVGSVKKAVTVFLSNQPPESVSIEVDIAPPPLMSESERSRNREMAKVDAQAVFKGGCADCHLTPSRGRSGAMLYDTLCGVCHEAAADRRASMVPNLHSLKTPTDYEFWKNVITNGKTNSLMPAFAIAHGGPLTDNQIASLAEYLARNISRNFQRPNALATNVPSAMLRRPGSGMKPVPTFKKIGQNTNSTLPQANPTTAITNFPVVQ